MNTSIQSDSEFTVILSNKKLIFYINLNVLDGISLFWKIRNNIYISYVSTAFKL